METIDWRSEAEGYLKILRQVGGDPLYVHHLNGLLRIIEREETLELSDFNLNDKELQKIRRAGSTSVLNQISTRLGSIINEEQKPDIIDQAAFEFGKGYVNRRRFKQIFRNHQSCFMN